MTGYGEFETAIEQGYDAVGANWRGFYMPKSASTEAKDVWSESIQKMTESEEFEKTLLEAGIEPFYNFGPDMDAYMEQNIGQITKVSKEFGIIQ